MKSARKAKDQLTRPVKERQKLVSISRNETMRMASMRESRDSDRTAAPRVWHFSAFHYLQ